MAEKFILGTRGSELARTQARLVEKAIQQTGAEVVIETRIIATKGDNTNLVDRHAGRKGLFTAEIERALLAGEVDVAVHSAKDLPSETHPDAQVAAVLPRASVNDLLVLKRECGLSSLPRGATVATGSVRRTRQLHWKRPDFKVVDLRGNVPTRLRKLAENEWDAIVLARAGLERLGFSATNGEFNFDGSRFFLEILSEEIFLPAGGQGIIALQIRADDERSKNVLNPINEGETLLCLEAEREFLRQLEADCDFPVGVFATINKETMKMRGQVFEDESLAPHEAQVEGVFEEGQRLARELLQKIEREHE